MLRNRCQPDKRQGVLDKGPKGLSPCKSGSERARLLEKERRRHSYEYSYEYRPWAS
jgi:hypothetical protein